MTVKQEQTLVVTYAALHLPLKSELEFVMTSVGTFNHVCERFDYKSIQKNRLFFSWLKNLSFKCIEMDFVGLVFQK